MMPVGRRSIVRCAIALSWVLTSPLSTAGKSPSNAVLNTTLPDEVIESFADELAETFAFRSWAALLHPLTKHTSEMLKSELMDALAQMGGGAAMSVHPGIRESIELMALMDPEDVVGMIANVFERELEAAAGAISAPARLGSEDPPLVILKVNPTRSVPREHVYIVVELQSEEDEVKMSLDHGTVRLLVSKFLEIVHAISRSERR